MEFEAHPLFLPDEDDDPAPVSEIQVCRIEQGQQVYYPRVFPASELQSLEQLAAELGGGDYILIARYDKKISTRRKYKIPGKSKPMYDEGRQEKEEKKEIPQPQVDPMAAMMGGQGGMLPFLAMMMQQMNSAADRQMQLIIAMMQSSKDSSAEDKANARAEMQANLERERIASEKQMAMMREMMQLAQANRGGGSDEQFTRGVEFMRTFANQQVEMLKMQMKGEKGEEADWMGLINTLGEALQGFNFFKQQMGGGGLPEGVPVPTPEVST